MSLLS
ncbi:uncharacterized protein FFFS_00030 [Fusarium fujikuroi]|jgi:hypothetical protein